MALIGRVVRYSIALVLLVVLFGAGWVTGRTGIGSVVDPASLTDLERQFTDRMRGVSLVGSYSMAGREDRPPRSDRYDISSVEKVGNDLWRFNARMDCCGVENATLPIVVPMRFFGDTPMITMTDTSIPGVGTFTVRVFFYGDRYAGTWQHGNYGGLMWGKIEKQAPAAQ
jgi:hypothetical protein